MDKYTEERPLRLVELFAGIGSQTQALKNIGVPHKVVAISEIDKYAIQSYEAMHGPTNNLGDIRKIDLLPDADMWTYSFPCLTGDTLVLTDKGYKRIDEVQLTDKVLTHTGEYRRVLAVYDQGVKPILKLRGMPFDEIRCTHNHRFLVRERTRANGHREFADPEWKEAQYLTRNDYIGIAINRNSAVPNWDGISFAWNDGRKARHKNELGALMRDGRFWWVIGRYLGDGWIRNGGGIIICCGKAEKHELTEKLDGLFDYTIVEERSVYKFHIPIKELGKFVEQFGKGAANKRLTDTVFDLPPDLLKSFIDGYISADGCRVNGLYKATSVSRELIYGIGQCVAKAYRRPYSVYKTERPAKYVIEGREVNQRCSYELTFKTETDKQDKAFFEDGYIWAPLTDICDCGEERVFDISVETDESFTANGVIVHNCQDISVAGKGAGIKEGTRSGLLFEVERLLNVAAENGTLPKYLLLENVKNLVSKKFKADFDRWLEFLSSLGYTNYWKVLNAKDYEIPQNRERVFCVSIRGEHTPFVFPEKRELKLRLRDLIDAVVDERYYLKESTIRSILTSNFHARRDSIKDTDKIAGTLLARDWRGPQCVQVGEVVGGKWDKMHDISRRVYEPDGLSPTVHCQGGGNTELKIKVEGNYSPSEHSAARIVDPNGLAPTVMENHGTVTAVTENVKQECFIRQAVETVLENDCEAGDTVDAFNRKINCSGVSPTITTRPEGFKTAILPIVKADRDDGVENDVRIGAMRGRNPDDPSDRTAGVPTAQRLEINDKGLCNTLTSVQKDNLVVESDYVARKYAEFISENGYVPEMFVAYNKMEVDDIAPTLTGQCSSASGSSAILKMDSPIAHAVRVGGHGSVDRHAWDTIMVDDEPKVLAPDNWGHKAGDGTKTRKRKETDIVPALQASAGQTQQSYLKVKVATKRGYDEATKGDYVNITYPGSKTKRGRVGKGIAQTLTCGDGNAVVTENVRIRKLTPRECLRLMGWKDEQIDKIAAARVSSTQQYRQAGNGIVVQVLEFIFKALFFGEV
ncbi:MAG: DNA (cytosine-5-)-methyltransferase [Ruminococcus flavefaciens]|nr:DNA (cytosine-5-)-methyltransferase [Ruminococcus flavefaciens]